MRPNYQSQKPEAALQRAHEFISVGKQRDALQSLHDLIKDRRHKQWSQTYEQIMLKYIELCVNLRNSALAKDGLYQYKIITQQVAVKSLETVLETFLQLAEQKTIEAQKHSIEKIEEIDDLDVGDAPENLLLSFVSGAVAQDRMDRTVLSPWLRFLWDAYRNCLDLLRNNIYVEHLYHQIARKSFAFCAKYQRRNEFRKLCEMLRMHLAQIQKAQMSTAAHSIKLSNMDSLSLMLETRLIQLDTAINMELWQEAYKSAEDLHNMMQLGRDKDKKIVKPTSQVNYYDKIALVFWKGGNTLFHAASLLQKFTIFKDMKKQFSDEEAMDQATRVLLATLSIPEGAENPSILTKHLDIEELHSANIRVLSSLLRLPITPSRAGILKEIARLNIPEMAVPGALELYKIIEVEFNPLRIASAVQKHLTTIDALNRPEYSQYANSIKRTVAAKVLKQVSTLYETLTLSRFEKLVPYYDRIELEHFLVDVCKQQAVKIHIDHRNNCIRFGPMDNTLASDLENEVDANVSEVDKIRDQLKQLYSQLNSVHLKLDNKSMQTAEEKLKRQIFIYSEHKDGDFERILARRKKIESYKENSEQMKQEKILQAQAYVTKQEEMRRQEEIKKLQEENKENEIRRRQNEQEEMRKKVAADKIKRYQTHPFYQQLLKEHGEEIFEQADPDQLIKERRQRYDAERREQQAKLQTQEKKYDHTVRAFHLEEMVLMKQISAERQKEAPEIHENYETKRIENAKVNRLKSFETFERLQRAKEDAVAFMRGVIQEHAEEFKTQKTQWEKQVNGTREKALKERAELRKQQRRREAKDAENRRIQEEQRKAEEEKRLAEQQKREQRRVEENASRQQQEGPRREREPEQSRQMVRAPRKENQPAEQPQPQKPGKYVPPSMRRANK